MLYEMYLQFHGRADKRQIKDPVYGLTHNLGGFPFQNICSVAIIGRKVNAIVNYDNFTIAPDVMNEYTYMVKGLVDRFYTRVTRYTTSTFLRMKLGDALERRDVSPHIYESRTEAQKALGISSKVENA